MRPAIARSSGWSSGADAGLTSPACAAPTISGSGSSKACWRGPTAWARSRVSRRTALSPLDAMFAPRLERRIKKLRDFDESEVAKRPNPAVTALSQFINRLLADLFGSNAVDYTNPPRLYLTSE